MGTKNGDDVTEHHSTPERGESGGQPSSSSSRGDDNNHRRQSHKYHGRNHFNRKKKKRFENGDNSKNIEDDFDLTIAEELNSGNYKMRGRRAQVSINHLLQLQFPEVKRSSENMPPRPARRKQNRNSSHIHLHGDSFVNAHYRVLANNRISYKEQSNNPNIPVPRENIVRIVVPRGQNCPICLSEEPVVPRMVVCGHIFCLSCLLSFFAAQETVKNKDTGYVQKRKFKECPLCGNILRSRNFKPVIFDSGQNQDRPEIGKESVFQLMCKPHGSMLPLPVELGVDPLVVGDFPPVEMSQLAPYARMMTCSSNHEIEFLEKDIDALNTQYEVDRVLYNDDGKFYKLALEELNASVARILQDIDNQPVDVPSLASLNLGGNLKEKYNESNAFFFFQTAFKSSTRYFLSPLDVKMLLFTFERYSRFPDELKAVVENVIYDTVVTEELIARYKYISHLPLGTEIAMIELDWRSTNLIPHEVYEKFAPGFKERRRRLNMRRTREEKQKKLSEKRIEKEHKEFYQRENGEEYGPEIIYDSSDPILDSLKSESNTTSSAHEPHKKERTIWGTSIPVDEEASRENQEFEAMLRQRMQQAEGGDGGDNTQPPTQSGKKNKKKKKSKVMLFSSNHQTL